MKRSAIFREGGMGQDHIHLTDSAVSGNKLEMLPRHSRCAKGSDQKHIVAYARRSKTEHRECGPEGKGRGCYMLTETM